ncbi:MAG TPA: tetratricopeptide repeat protein [Casimicrobiaceae bacterium]
MKHDARGIPVSSGSAEAIALYESAIGQLQSFVGDPIATIDRALVASPEFVVGHAFKALALATFSERQFAPAIADAVALARRHGAKANARERGLVAAAQHLSNGTWNDACVALDAVLVDHPRDALALQVAHLMDFYRGDALNLRNRVARVLPHWGHEVPGYSYVLGMYAFGLEEMNQYEEAEETARAALAIQRRDSWAVHAAAHVMEMQGRIDEGIAWLASRERDWSPDNGLAVHNYWHLALFHLDRGDHARVLAVYDSAIHAGPAPTLLSLVDATALLWRLKLDGADVGRRFVEVADEWEAKLDGEGGFYAFNDLHAALAFAATGRDAAIAKLVPRMQQAAEARDANAAMTRDVGLPLVKGVAAYARGRYDEAVDAIAPVRDVAHRFGGSHAQRDVLTLTLVDAARRAGRTALAKHVLAERLAAKPEAQWGRRILARIDAKATVAH